MSFFDEFENPVPPAAPGDLLWLACDVSSLMGQMGDLPEGSPARQAKAREILRHRTALAESVPETDLDLLVLTLNASQAMWLLEYMPLDEARRKYWAAEASRALVRIQYCLERRCGATTDQLDLNFAGGLVNKGP